MATRLAVIADTANFGLLGPSESLESPKFASLGQLLAVQRAVERHEHESSAANESEDRVDDSI